MTGLDKIKEKIISEAKIDSARVIDDAQKRCNEIIQRAQDETSTVKAELKWAADREAESIISLARSGAAMEKRGIIAEAKCGAIDLAFDAAKKYILEQSDGKYTELLAWLLISAVSDQLELERTNKALYGEVSEEFPIDIFLSQKDLGTVGGELIPTAKRLCAGTPAAHALSRAGVSVEAVPIGGGLKVRIGDIDINCSLEAILSETRERLEGEVAAILFDRG